MRYRILLGLLIFWLAISLKGQQLYYVKVVLDKESPGGWVWEQGGTLSLSIITPISVRIKANEKVSLSSHLSEWLPGTYKQGNFAVYSSWSHDKTSNLLRSNLKLNFGLPGSGKINLTYNQARNTNKYPVYPSLVFQSIALGYSYSLSK